MPVITLLDVTAEIAIHLHYCNYHTDILSYSLSAQCIPSIVVQKQWFHDQCLANKV